MTTLEPIPTWSKHVPSEHVHVSRAVRIVAYTYDREHPPGCPLPLKRDQHGEEYGTLHGTLAVNTDDVPADMRYGLLAHTGMHPVIARFSPNAPVPWPLCPPVGLGLKVLNVRAPDDAGRTPLTQDFLLGAKTDRFFCASAEDAVALVKARARGGLRGLMTYFLPSPNPHNWRITELRVLVSTMLRRVPDLLTRTRYYSQTPISCGPDLMVKVAVQMDATRSLAWPGLRRPDLKARMHRHLMTTPAPFTLLFQRQQPGESVDDVRRSWKGPWVPVAHGTFPPQTPISGEGLTITLAHCHPDHEAQGPIPRVRIAVYKAISDRRHAPSATP
jgi:hypothetical protein